MQGLQLLTLKQIKNKIRHGINLRNYLHTMKCKEVKENSANS